MPSRRALAIALLCALPPVPAMAGDDAPTHTVAWLSPWGEGTTLEYASEELTTSNLHERERTRSTAIATVRITDTLAPGFVQQWSWRDPTFVVEEGDRAREAATRQFNARMQDVPLAVELDGNGNYQRLRDLERLAPRLRKVMRPMLQANLDARLAQVPDAEVRQSARRLALAELDGFLERMLAPQRLELLLARNLQWYNAFTGVDLEPGQEYTAPVQLPAPDGGAPIPAELTYSLSVFEDDSEDLYFAFSQEIDRDLGGAAAVAIVEGLLGSRLDEAARSLDISIVDEGMFVVDRASGVVEMFETTRTVRVGERSKVERQRLRLLNAGHGHDWRPDADVASATP